MRYTLVPGRVHIIEILMYRRISGRAFARTYAAKRIPAVPTIFLMDNQVDFTSPPL
jgi:hypothetical protein